MKNGQFKDIGTIAGRWARTTEDNLAEEDVSVVSFISNALERDNILCNYDQN